MDDRSVGGSLQKHLLPGEKLVYQAPRNWSQLIGFMFILLLVVLMGAVYVFLSGWQQNVANLQIPWLKSQSDAALVQGIGILRLAVLLMAGLALISTIPQMAVLLRAKLFLTDRRILGRTGKFISRPVDIPLDKIAWVDSEEPIDIHTKDGKHTKLWNVAKRGVFLGYLESAYAPESRPVIHKQGARGLPIVLVAVVILALAAVGIYALYSARESDDEPTQPRDAQPVVVVDTAAPESTITEQDTATPLPTQRPAYTPTPKPAEADFASITGYPQGTRVTMAGELVLPSRISCDEDCGVFLRNPKQYSEKIPIFLFIPLAGNTPAPNQMARLKEQYREEDFQVRMDNGSYAGNYSAVRITGKICQTTDGDVAICDISKIEPGK